MLKGLGNLANIGQMMQQAQQMGAKLKEAQEALKAKKVTGAAGGGLIEVDMNGAGQTLAVRIDPSLVEKQDREMIEDLLPAALNDAAAKIEALRAETMQEATGGLNLPGMEGLSEMLGGDKP